MRILTALNTSLCLLLASSLTGCQNPRKGSVFPTSRQNLDKSQRLIDARIQQVARLFKEKADASPNGKELVALAYLQGLEIISQNLANAWSFGYQRQPIHFEEQLGRASTALAGSADFGNPTNILRLFTNHVPLRFIPPGLPAGDLTFTNEELDLAILGDGYFEVRLPHGTSAFTRNGRLIATSNGGAQNSDGHPMAGGFEKIPPHCTRIQVSRAGKVVCHYDGGTMAFQVQLSGFSNPAGLRVLGPNLYGETETSGRFVKSNPGDKHGGVLKQRYLELSTVKAAQEIEELIVVCAAREVFSQGQCGFHHESPIEKQVLGLVAFLAGKLKNPSSNHDPVIQACLLDLAAISENLKNTGTCGYKRLNCRPRVQIGNAGAISPATAGEGFAPEMSFSNPPQRDFSEGELLHTGEMLDLAIAGEGFFEVEMPDGTSAYTRDGQFSIGGEGKVLNSSGYALRSGFQPIPMGTTNFQISPKGQVDCFSKGGIWPFQIQLCRFTNAGGLRLEAPILFRATESSGPPEVFLPGENQTCELVQGYLENSNANLEAEVVELIQFFRVLEVYSLKKRTQKDMPQTNKLMALPNKRNIRPA